MHNILSFMVTFKAISIHVFLKFIIYSDFRLSVAHGGGVVFDLAARVWAGSGFHAPPGVLLAMLERKALHIKL